MYVDAAVFTKNDAVDKSRDLIHLVTNISYIPMFPIIEGISDWSRKSVAVLRRLPCACHSIFFIKPTASSAVCRHTLLKMLRHISLAASVFLYYQTCPIKLGVSNAIFVIFHIVIISVKVKFTLEQATKAQRGSRCIAVLLLQPRR